VLDGASMGGLNGLMAQAAEKPFSALVLVDITPRWEASGVERILGFMSAHPEGFASYQDAADQIAAYLPHRRARKTPAQLAHLLVPRADGRLAWHWDPRLLSEFIPGTHDLSGALDAACRALDVPVLLVSGGRSDLVSDETVAHFLDLAPHARHVRLPDATHMVAGDDNDAFADTLLSFLQDLTAPAAARTGDPR
jgi:pimeloyl-ACP methyl ester carboxylesterase